MEGKIKITVKQSSGDQFEVEVEPKCAIKDLKASCAAK